LPEPAEAPELLYRLEIGALDLGSDVQAVGLELIDPQNREPVTGREAAAIWSALLPALAEKEPWALDFYAHLDRVREFCRLRQIEFREPNTHTIVIPAVAGEQLTATFERFAGESFGIRAGGPVLTGDPEVEGRLAERGIDAYHTAFPHYFFCAVCDFEGGFLTVISNRLWASEVMRRARPVLTPLQVDVTRPA